MKVQAGLYVVVNPARTGYANAEIAVKLFVSAKTAVRSAPSGRN
jgi:hypothetical protein